MIPTSTGFPGIRRTSPLTGRSNTSKDGLLRYTLWHSIEPAFNSLTDERFLNKQQRSLRRQEACSLCRRRRSQPDKFLRALETRRREACSVGARTVLHRTYLLALWPGAY